MGIKKGSGRKLRRQRSSRRRLRRKRTVRKRQRAGAPSETCKTCNRPFATGWAQVALGTHCVRGACPHNKPNKQSKKKKSVKKMSMKRTTQSTPNSPPPRPALKRQTAVDYSRPTPSGMLWTSDLN